MKYVASLALIGLAFATNARGADQQKQVIIFDGKTTQLSSFEVRPAGLWLSTKDLQQATGFEIKPQGVCRDELCFPIPAKRKAEFVNKRGSVTWFNLTAFASLTHQAVARDEKNGVWYFGPRGQAHESYLESMDAPDFTLADQDGKMHSLSQYRGTKVLLLTWASW